MENELGIIVKTSDLSPNEYRTTSGKVLDYADVIKIVTQQIK